MSNNQLNDISKVYLSQVAEETPGERIDRKSQEGVAKRSAAASSEKESRAKKAGEFQKHKQSVLAKGGRHVDALDSWHKKQAYERNAKLREEIKCANSSGAPNTKTEEWKPDPVERRKKKSADLYRREKIAQNTPAKYKTDKTEDPDKLYRRRMAVDSKTKMKESFSNWRDEIVEGKDKDEKNESFVLEREDSPYEKASDKALDKKYGYGTSHDKGPKTGFGRASNRTTAAAVLRNIRGGGSTPETRADAAHKGWSHTARTSADQTPEKKATRKKLADTPYKKLPKDEQEKDQVAADAVKKEYEGRKKTNESVMPNVDSKDRKVIKDCVNTLFKKDLKGEVRGVYEASGRWVDSKGRSHTFSFDTNIVDHEYIADLVKSRYPAKRIFIKTDKEKSKEKSKEKKDVKKVKKESFSNWRDEIIEGKGKDKEELVDVGFGAKVPKSKAEEAKKKMNASVRGENIPGFKGGRLD